MKKHLLFLFATLLPLLGSAQDFKFDGIYYNITSEADKTAEVTSSGGTKYSGSITIPATVTYGDVTYSVTSIGYSAFYNCSSLTAITLPEGVTSIGHYAFYNCSSLTAITLPEGVTSIGSCAFSACSSLTAITIPEGVTSIGDSAFRDCSSLTAITLPKSVTSIGDYAFRNCRSLIAISLPEGITSIGNGVFKDCRSLIAITLPEEVTSIGERAFESCISLTGITIPEGVTSLGGNALSACTSLTYIACLAGTPPEINYNAFDLVDTSIPLYVPAGSVEAYKKSTYWNMFNNTIGIEAGIENPECATQNSAIIYDLTGRRVENPTKGGIYIVNGKKVVIK